MTTGSNLNKVPSEMNRRRFFLAAAGGAAVLAAGAMGLAAPSKAVAGESKVVSPEQQLCIGCVTCEVACSRWHASQGLSPLARIRVLRSPEVKPDNPVAALAGGLGFEPRGCRQCPKPECLAVCPANALRIDSASGARYINEQACIGCGKCEEACPYPIKGLEVSTSKSVSSKRIWYDAGRKIYVKCDLCRGRKGGPACIEQCPVNLGISKGIIRSEKKTLTLADGTESAWKQVP